MGVLTCVPSLWPWVAPQQIAVVRIEAEHALEQERDDLLLAVDLDEKRRRISVVIVALPPDNRTSTLIEGHERAARGADGEDDRVLVRERAAGIAALTDVAVQVDDQVVFPEDAAGFPLKTMELS